MAILKCKMCGGDIQATDSTYGTCDSCGSTMTLPKAADEQKANLFNRANNLRMRNEFDKAIATYENILNMDASSSEAHWGVVLSKYGIEYVEDPATGRRIPTCHRVQSESILTDSDYLSALENAGDAYTRSLYEEEAGIISDIQKRILAISSKEEPYDIFICYKETDESGTRTKDSALAQDIYYQLEKEGFKVFFSRISLEKKLGRQYEPYIFNALNSAKVMLAVGTKPEYFNAVWVKNEWSRFLALMKKDSSRLLIPCYRDMDAYDLPEEMAMLQAQDMSKIGFAQDVIHGVKKVLESPKADTAQTSSAAGISSPAAPGVESLMKRGRLFLEDSDWKQADEYFDRVLDIDAEYAPAYVGKLCAELGINVDKLSLAATPFSGSKNYQKAVRYADDAYCVKLQECNQAALKRAAETYRRKLGPLYKYSKIARAEAAEEMERQQKSAEERLREENARRKAEYDEKAAEAHRKYQTAYTEWQARSHQLHAEYYENNSIWEQRIAPLKTQYENAYRAWEAAVYQKRTQADKWNSQRLCPHCGGKIALFGGACKECKKKTTDPLILPFAPEQPNLPQKPVLSLPAEPQRPQISEYEPLTLSKESGANESIESYFEGDRIFVRFAQVPHIDWRVLAVEGDKAFLISEKIIETQAAYQ